MTILILPDVFIHGTLGDITHFLKKKKIMIMKANKRVKIDFIPLEIDNSALQQRNNCP